MNGIEVDIFLWMLLNDLSTLEGGCSDTHLFIKCHIYNNKST